MIEIYTPGSEMETINLRSILAAYDVPFHVRNDTFGTMRPGIRIPHYNAKSFMVPAERADEARALIADYLRTVGAGPARVPVWHRLRMALEFVCLGWLFPYRPHAPASASKRTAPVPDRRRRDGL